MNKSIKGILCFALILAMCLSFSSFAYAAEPTPEFGDIAYEDENIVVLLGNPNDPDAPISKTAASITRHTDYESVWLNGNAQGSFPIYCTHSGTVGITIAVESSSNSSWANVSIQKPNKSYYYPTGIAINRNTNGGDGWYAKMRFASTGTYTIHYTAVTPVGMRIMCWMY
jgi:hypothetical protein